MRQQIQNRVGRDNFRLLSPPGARAPSRRAGSFLEGAT